MAITVKDLAIHLEKMVKDGKGGLLVKVVQLKENIALPLARGDVLALVGTGEKFLMLVPEEPYNIPTLDHKIITH